MRFLGLLVLGGLSLTCSFLHDNEKQYDLSTTDFLINKSEFVSGGYDFRPQFRYKDKDKDGYADYLYDVDNTNPYKDIEKSKTYSPGHSFKTFVFEEEDPHIPNSDFSDFVIRYRSSKVFYDNSENIIRNAEIENRYTHRIKIFGRVDALHKDTNKIHEFGFSVTNYATDLV